MAMTPKNIKIEASPEFIKNLDHLLRKYKGRKLDQEVGGLIVQLENGDTPGDRVPGVHYAVYKVRLKGAGKGKRGGFRVIYYLQTETFILLVTIYAKSEQSDIRPEQIRRIIDRYDHEDTPE